MALVTKLGGGKEGDPSLFIDLVGKKRALLFDCGLLTELTPREILRVRELFISHTHIDHFIGFDYILRLILERKDTLKIYGPPGIAQNIQGKLKGYNWNIGQEIDLTIIVQEVMGEILRITRYQCKNQFDQDKEVVLKQNHNIFLDDHDLTVDFLPLDHKTISLAYRIIEKPVVKVDKEKLRELQLPPGPWLRQLKEAMATGNLETNPIEIKGQLYSSTYLQAHLLRWTKGSKVVYLTDARLTETAKKKIISFARDSDIFYCEGMFLDKDKDKALATYHLTAREAAILAREAQVKKLVLFHFSPRYQDRYNELIAEARKEFHQSY
jgi:ribonuclease Z